MTEEFDSRIKASYKPSQFITLADKMEDSFNSNWCDQTDEDAIYSIMRKLKNNPDWLELNKDMDHPLRSNMFNIYNHKQINLVKGLQLELDTKEKNKVNYILKSKGITYRI